MVVVFWCISSISSGDRPLVSGTQKKVRMKQHVHANQEHFDTELGIVLTWVDKIKGRLFDGEIPARWHLICKTRN